MTRGRKRAILRVRCEKRRRTVETTMEHNAAEEAASLNISEEVYAMMEKARVAHLQAVAAAETARDAAITYFGAVGHRMSPEGQAEVWTWLDRRDPFAALAVINAELARGI